MAQRLSCAIASAAAFLLLGSSTAVLAAPQPALVPGGIAVVRVVSATGPAPQVTFNDARALVIRRDGAWQAIVGIPLDAAPGEHSIQVWQGNGALPQKLPFKVHAKAYPEQRITLKDPSKVQPPAEELPRIEREQETMNRVRAAFRDSPQPDIDLRLPAMGRLSGRFGSRRILNGEPRSPHGGLDVAIPAGTRVSAAAAGVVANIGSYFFCGNTAFIDHGQGLITMYCHLQNIEVEPGQSVARGQLLGHSGMSGRATGPHLHWSVYLNGTAVDPELFLSAKK